MFRDVLAAGAAQQWVIRCPPLQGRVVSEGKFSSVALWSRKRKSPRAEGQLLGWQLITERQVGTGAGRAQLPSRFAAKILASRQHPGRGDGAPSRRGDTRAAGEGVGAPAPGKFFLEMSRSCPHLHVSRLEPAESLGCCRGWGRRRGLWDLPLFHSVGWQGRVLRICPLGFPACKMGQCSPDLRGFSLNFSN